MSPPEYLYGGQFTLSTQLRKPNYLAILPPTQHHSFFRNLPPFLAFRALWFTTFSSGTMNYSVFLISDISGPRRGNKVKFEQFTILLIGHHETEDKRFRALPIHEKISRGLATQDLVQIQSPLPVPQRSAMIVTQNPRCITTRILTNSFVKAPNPFPFHSFYEAIQKSFVNRPINRLGLETNFQRVEGMAH